MLKHTNFGFGFIINQITIDGMIAKLFLKGGPFKRLVTYVQN